MDIQAFVQHQERDRKPFLANEPEVDGLVRPNRLLFTRFRLLNRFIFTDDQSDTSAADTLTRIREGTGTV